MSNDGVNKGRRRLLIGATSAVGAVGAVGAAVPFVASWNPSAKAKTAGAPVKVDVSKLEPGQQMVVKWRGKPVWIVRRSEETLAKLPGLDSNMQDPNSEASIQPEYVPKDATRAIRSDIAVLVGICTHLGCSPTYIPVVGAASGQGDDWIGGYYCPCHGSRFDLSGRVMNGSPAPSNLVIPPHHYESDNVVIVGVDQETA